ncbi:MAG: zinc ABC transporter permease subunit ZnuB [Rhodospirillales bacterium]|nr:zinc ABC transporter permease subunit ZnuB [Rhodospirillales bacterium]
MDDFVWRAMVAGVGLAAVTGPLGSFVVWRRLAFFGDALAHSALLGVTLGFALGINLNFGVVAVCVAFALLLALLQGRARLASDTLLGIFAHSALSFGLVALAFQEGLRVDLMSYLFGDILAVTPLDLVWIYGGGAAVLAVLAWLWRPLLSLAVHEELARVEGVPVDRLRFAFVLLFAVVVAAAMKIVGVLLITALLIIPAATARRFARSPEQMAVLAALIGGFAVVGGVYASLYFDTPSGPSTVVAAAVMFALSSLWPRRRMA